jgi:hypothetical protein
MTIFYCFVSVNKLRDNKVGNFTLLLNLYTLKFYYRKLRTFKIYFIQGVMLPKKRPPYEKFSATKVIKYLVLPPLTEPRFYPVLTRVLLDDF